MTVAGKSSITDADIKIAEQKFEESKDNSMNGMIALQDAEVSTHFDLPMLISHFRQVEQIAQLRAFVQANIAFHQSAASALEALNDSLNDITSSVGPRQKRVVKVARSQSDDEDDDAPVAKAAPVKPSGSGGSNKAQ